MQSCDGCPGQHFVSYSMADLHDLKGTSCAQCTMGEMSDKDSHQGGIQYNLMYCMYELCRVALLSSCDLTLKH